MPARWRIADLSTNGTYVNGEIGTTPIAASDRVYVGDLDWHRRARRRPAGFADFSDTPQSTARNGDRAPRATCRRRRPRRAIGSAASRLPIDDDEDDDRRRPARTNKYGAGRAPAAGRAPIPPPPPPPPPRRPPPARQPMLDMDDYDSPTAHPPASQAASARTRQRRAVCGEPATGEEDGETEARAHGRGAGVPAVDHSAAALLPLPVLRRRAAGAGPPRAARLPLEALSLTRRSCTSCSPRPTRRWSIAAPDSSFTTRASVTRTPSPTCSGVAKPPTRRRAGQPGRRRAAARRDAGLGRVPPR